MPDDARPTYPSGQLRDRMANERTLLAWIRTALALMGFGLVVAKFSLFLDMVGASAGIEGDHGVARVAGVILVLIGVFVTLVGARRTVIYAKIIDPEARPPGDGVLVGTSVIVVALGIGLAIYLALA
ncbi:MAG: DUF202 domain-containing protein [Myxococcales bacterium]|nr:DUF202 domain-containing protein [Myxococcales bacterium]MCB9701755.1 DUF202 domain-containing protein [Myxococcales bacterium]